MTRELPAIDTAVAHSPRIWNYWLGGKDHFEIDRRVGDVFRTIYPPIVDIARSSRAFLRRAVRHLAAEDGVRQFLDIGSGVPMAENTHDVAQAVAPDARVVYVDNDPVVLAHSRVLLQGAAGTTTYIGADLRDPARLVELAGRDLAWDRPVALLLSNVLGHVADGPEAERIVAELVSALAPGSHLVVVDGTTDGGAFDVAVEMWNQAGSLPYVLRTPEQISRYFDGLELLEPGFVPPALWRPDAAAGRVAGDAIAAVGRKP